MAADLRRGVDTYLPAVDDGSEAFREARRLAAEEIWDLAAPSFGPGGRGKLVQQGDASFRFVRSGAQALRETPQASPVWQPYVDLATALQVHVGDQATAGVLLASRLVTEAFALQDRGVRIPVVLAGYEKACRQAKAILTSLQTPDPTGQAMRGVAPGRHAWADVILEGLRGAGVADLDRIVVRHEEGDAPAWTSGIRVDPQFVPAAPASDAGVLVLFDDWKPFLYRENLQYTIREGSSVPAFVAEEDRLRQLAVDHIVSLRVGLVVCVNELDPMVAGMLAMRGVATWNDAPKDVARAVETATGARRVARPHDATQGDLGRGRLRRRRDAWFLEAEGFAWTLGYPGATDSACEENKDVVEKLLRAAALHLRDPTAVPGSGRSWRMAAQGLARAAHAATGKEMLAVAAAGKAMERVAEELVRQAGKDPTRVRDLPDADGCTDLALAVRLAWDAAFDTARTILRMDNMYSKRVSAPSYIRGTTGRPTKVEAGDVPPDM